MINIERIEEKKNKKQDKNIRLLVEWKREKINKKGLDFEMNTMHITHYKLFILLLLLLLIRKNTNEKLSQT